jgi:hypothetical protein
VRPPGVEKTSRLRSRDPVASGVKCGPHGGMNSKMKSWTVSWLCLKTKVKPGLRGSRVMSGDWRRLHRVRGVSGGSPENHWVPWLIHTRRDRMACVEATQGAVAGHPSDGEDIKNSKTSLEGLVSLVSREGHFRHSVASI